MRLLTKGVQVSIVTCSRVMGRGKERGMREGERTWGDTGEPGVRETRVPRLGKGFLASFCWELS